MKVLILLITITFSCTIWAQAEVAVVKMIRGEALMLNNGKKTPLKAESKVIAGSTVQTSDKSFVRLIFIDKSQMNIGPNSEMKIEQFGGGDAGVIDLVKGKIRSQVSKDYLQQKDKDKSKLFIKTPNAVMGVRGTDFMISTNGANTSTVLFEGEVVFNKLIGASSRDFSTDSLEAVVNGPGTARMQPGEFSVQLENGPQPTVPSILNVQQLETLETNPEFSQDRAPGQNNIETSSKSVVPPGLSGESASNQPDSLKSEISQVVKQSSPSPVITKPNTELAKGYESNGQVKPTNGSFLHVDSGVVIPPPKNSVYDSNSNTFIAAGGKSQVSADGSYQPPKNVTITTGGKVLLQSGNQVVEIKPSSTVMGKGSTLGDVMNAVSTAPASGATSTSTTGTVAGVKLPSTTTSTSSTSTVSLPPPEAPTLCSTCGGAVPGSAATVSTSSNVTFVPTVQ